MLFYKLYQEKRKESVNKGKWYARVKHLGTLTTEDLIEEIEKLCTVTDADAVAVIRALIYTMNDKLRNGYALKINGMGTFKIGLETIPADTPEEFSAQKNIVGSRMNFQPEVHYNGDHVRIRKFLSDLSVAELPLNTVVSKKQHSDDEGDDDGNG